MGGAANCGAEFSPASGLFAVDEALFEVVQEIKAQRMEAIIAAEKSNDKEQAAQLRSQFLCSTFR